MERLGLRQSVFDRGAGGERVGQQSAQLRFALLQALGQRGDLRSPFAPGILEPSLEGGVATLGCTDLRLPGTSRLVEARGRSGQVHFNGGPLPHDRFVIGLQLSSTVGH